MPADTVLFLDFDDTLSDMRALAGQYFPALGRLLASEFGGAEQEWAAAAARELTVTVEAYHRRFVGGRPQGFSEWVREERIRVVRAIFESMQVPAPDGEVAIELGRRTQFQALSACNAAYPGAADAIRALRERGVSVNMASSQESEYLRAAAIGMGLDGQVERMYGADLIDHVKEGPEFYQRIFADCGIRPSQAIVVDDQAICLDWAEEAGARVIQACMKQEPDEPEFPIVLHSMAGLPALVTGGG